MELWADIKNYENYYQVSNFGRIRSLNRKFECNGKNQYSSFKTVKTYKGKIIKPLLDNRGYFYVFLCKNNVKKNIPIHRLVAKTFIPNPENKPQVNHIDGNKTNNNVTNLEWATCSENIQHAYRNNLFTNQLESLKKIQKNNEKSVLQYDLNGNFIKEWESIKEAKKELKVSSHISCCCNGKRKTAGGYIWKF